MSQPALHHPTADDAAARTDPARPASGRAASAPGDNLGRRTASGFVWLMVQTIGSKFVGMAGQVILAWILAPQHLGLWAKASVVLGFAGLIQQAGLRETLIHRQRNYHLWANAAFWMSVGLGLVGGAFTAAAGAAAWYVLGDDRLAGMLFLLAATAPLMSLDLVAEAKLQNQMRFGLLAKVNWAIAVAQLALTVLFALALDHKYKAFAFVLPRPVIAVTRMAILWNAARPPVRRRIDLGRWRYMLGDSATLFTSNLFLMLQWQGDYIVIWLLFAAASDSVLGIYFLAFNLSIQTMQLFTGNLTGVLFPALSKLQGDPKRQIRAFLDATRLLAVVAVPMCLLQMGGADPGVRMLFQDDKWADAIPVLQALSAGMAFRVVASPGGSLIQAQGRFRVILITNVINAIVFLALVTAGAVIGKYFEESPNLYSVWLMPYTTVGLAVAVYFATVSPVFLYVAIRPSGGTWADVGRVYAAPLAASALAVAGAMALGSLVPTHLIRGHRWAQGAKLAVIIVWFVLLYVPLIRMLTPGAWDALLARVASLYQRRTRAEAPVTA